MTHTTPPHTRAEPPDAKAEPPHTRAEHRQLTHTDVCREGCGRFVLGTPATPAAVVIANVYAAEDGHTLLGPAATRARWVRTVIFHGACYDDRYGPARAPADADRRRRARPLNRAS